MLLEGGVSKNYTQNWDKDGNIYYTDETGQTVAPSHGLNWLQKQGRKLQAFGDNLYDYIQNPTPAQQKEKENLTLAAVTAPFGGGATFGAQFLKPLVGKKIAQTMAQGIGSGLVGGSVEGFGSGVINNENPIKTAAVHGALGALGGGVIGGGLGKIEKQLARNNLLKQWDDALGNEYFNNYISDLNNKSAQLGDYRGIKQGINTGSAERLFDKNNPIHVKQAELINKYNPANDNYHTWIRNADDIYDFEDTLKPPQFDPDFIGNDFDPSYSWDMAQDALQNGEIEVFSSYPIKKGIFVTPSSMEAASYSGTGKIYSKIVPLRDVAWIDPTQGQYAPVQNKLYNNIKNSIDKEHL